MFTFDQAARLARLQARLWGALAEAMRADGHRKSADGTVEVSFIMPAAWNWDEQPAWALTIHSYALCHDGRRETFSASTFEGALSQAEAYAHKICFGFEMQALDREIGNATSSYGSAEDADDAE